MTPEKFSREMGLTHAEFFKSLPAALDHQPYERTASGVRVDYGDRSLEIDLGPQQERRIALLRLPYADVQFRFRGFPDDAREVFMQRFDLCFRRGGG